MKLHITAKCSDMCSLQLVDESGHTTESDGYVPHWFPNPSTEHYGDYVQLTIDMETGHIVGWKKPTQKQLAETFKLTKQG